MHHCKFLLELKAPSSLVNIEKLYKKIQNLINRTGRVSIASKPFGSIVSGFDLSYNLASYLIERNGKLDILFHVTCYDLNKVNIKSRLILLKQLGIKRLLVVSGDGYKLEKETLQFVNSHELAECIIKDFNWFDSIAIAGYPGGNGTSSHSNQQECRRLSGLMRKGVTEIYTQCIFDLETFFDFKRQIKLEFPEVRVIPSVALFKNSLDLDRVARLTRVSGVNFTQLLSDLKQLEQMNPDKSSEFAHTYLSKLCKQLLTHSDLIDLSTFGQFELAESLIRQSEGDCFELMEQT